MVHFLKSNDIFGEEECGFRKGCYTLQGLRKVVEDVVESLEEGNCFSLTMCNVSKALHIILHDLMKKAV